MSRTLRVCLIAAAAAAIASPAIADRNEQKRNAESERELERWYAPLISFDWISPIAAPSSGYAKRATMELPDPPKGSFDQSQPAPPYPRVGLPGGQTIARECLVFPLPTHCPRY